MKITYAVHESGRKIRIGGTLAQGKSWMRAYNKNYGHKHKGKAVVAVYEVEKKARPKHSRPASNRFGMPKMRLFG